MQTFPSLLITNAVSFIPSQSASLNVFPSRRLFLECFLRQSDLYHLIFIFVMSMSPFTMSCMGYVHLASKCEWVRAASARNFCVLADFPYGISMLLQWNAQR